MLFVRHVARTLGEVWLYCWDNDRIWPLLLILMLLAAGFLAGGTAVLTPFIYSIF